MFSPSSQISLQCVPSESKGNWVARANLTTGIFCLLARINTTHEYSPLIAMKYQKDAVRIDQSYVMLTCFIVKYHCWNHVRETHFQNQVFLPYFSPRNLHFCLVYDSGGWNFGVLKARVRINPLFNSRSRN